MLAGVPLSGTAPWTRSPARSVFPGLGRRRRTSTGACCQWTADSAWGFEQDEHYARWVCSTASGC